VVKSANPTTRAAISPLAVDTVAVTAPGGDASTVTRTTPAAAASPAAVQAPWRGSQGRAESLVDVMIPEEAPIASIAGAGVSHATRRLDITTAGVANAVPPPLSSGIECPE
jgi:hypothetical protein